MASIAPSPVQLSQSERSPKSLTVTHTLSEAVDAFYADTDLRLLPIVDQSRRPVGAIFEKEIRRLLLNPYGHALLCNPSYSHNLAGHVRQCPTTEVTDDVGALIDHYRRCDGREGMILTSNGQLYATLTNRRLLLLASEHEQKAAQARLDRADRIAEAGLHFEMRVGALSGQMVQLADSVQQLAEATAKRSDLAGVEATSVAAATSQTRASLSNLAERGRSLAQAFGRIEKSVTGNRQIARSTAIRVQDGEERARELLKSAQAIDNVMAMVAEISATVNLLSLNATIEAARAGEAGRGFAVVASEIRKLSDQTQQATQAIGGQVHALRGGIEMVASDYSEVVEAIASMASGAKEIDNAVSHEAGTTRLIATSVSDAGQASATIEEAVRAIASSVRSASTSARELDRLANDLRSGASALNESVESFLFELRAA